MFFKVLYFIQYWAKDNYIMYNVHNKTIFEQGITKKYLAGTRI